MIVVDIGNANVVIGIYIKSKLNYIHCFETKSEKIVGKNTVQAMQSGFYWG